MAGTTTRYGGRFDDHEVEIEFDKTLVVINRIRLIIDGLTVDAAKVVYGDREMQAEASDGTPVHVIVSSGMMGELVRAQVRRGDGSLVDLQERATS